MSIVTVSVLSHGNIIIYHDIVIICHGDIVSVVHSICHINVMRWKEHHVILVIASSGVVDVASVTVVIDIIYDNTVMSGPNR